ncbi:bile acid:sodium symporter [Klebsiella pneumoniae]|nr:bile acid:sodium symporter [Klebsiella pneumoniae]
MGDSSTFILFPLPLGVLFAWWAPVNVDPMLYSGFIYLCILAGHRATTSPLLLAGGNVAAAVCSASASSLLGDLVSPLVGVLMNLHGAGGSRPSRSVNCCCSCCCLCSVTYRAVD